MCTYSAVGISESATLRSILNDFVSLPIRVHGALYRACDTVTEQTAFKTRRSLTIENVQLYKRKAGTLKETVSGSAREQRTEPNADPTLGLVQDVFKHSNYC